VGSTPLQFTDTILMKTKKNKIEEEGFVGGGI